MRSLFVAFALAALFAACTVIYGPAGDVTVSQSYSRADSPGVVFGQSEPRQ